MWYLQQQGFLDSGEQEGPYDNKQLMELALNGKIASNTLVSHKVNTKGQWFEARQLPAIHKVLEQRKRDEKEKKQEIKNQKTEAKNALKTLDEIPPILAKKNDSNKVWETNLLDFVRSNEYRKDNVTGAFKPTSKLLPKIWRKYNYFESVFLNVSCTQKHRDKIQSLGTPPPTPLTYVQAEELIASLESELPPTPSVREELAKHGQDPDKFTRGSANTYLAEKETQEEATEELAAKKKWLKKINNLGISFKGDINSVDLSELEEFDELVDDYKKEKLDYPLPKELTAKTLAKEIEIMNDASDFFDDMKDILDDMREEKEIRRKLKQGELKELFPIHIEKWRREGDGLDSFDLYALIRKLYPDIIV